MKVIPIMMPAINWTAYIAEYQDKFGVSPLRKLDEFSIKTNDVAAFLAALHPEEDPNSQITQLGPQHKLLHFGFLFSCDPDLALELCMSTRLHLSIQAYKKQLMVVCVGSLQTWFEAILLGCSREASQEMRECMNACYLQFQSTGYVKLLWDRYQKTDIEDGTFVLT